MEGLEGLVFEDGSSENVEAIALPDLVEMVDDDDDGSVQYLFELAARYEY